VFNRYRALYHSTSPPLTCFQTDPRPLIYLQTAPAVCRTFPLLILLASLSGLSPITMSSSDHRLRFAVFGLGRMGSRHARNVAFLTPRAELAAVVDPSEEARNAAKEWLPRSVKLYDNVKQCLEESGCEAVLIASATAAHAEDAIAAIEAGRVSQTRSCSLHLP